jgi:hypothetical protein
MQVRRVAELDLEKTQQWMMHVIGHVSGGVSDALAAREARALVPLAELGSVIVPSRTLTPAERIGIYHGMYPLRMVEALGSDYPALQHFLGDDAFADLARAYVTKHPSRSYTLNRLGDHLPEFVAKWRGTRRAAFAAELARLERAVTQAFDAPETDVLGEPEIASVGERIEGARVVPIPALRLLAFRYPVNAYLQSVRDEDHDHPRTALRPSWVAVYRRSYTVRRLELSRDEHTLLHALASGVTLGKAVRKTMRSARRRLAPDDFFRWFRVWVQAGLFRSIG